MNWKEQFDNNFTTVYDEDSDHSIIGFDIDISPFEVEYFIRTEIIEKLIEEIPPVIGSVVTDGLKQQLRDKWLGSKREPTPLKAIRISEAHRNFSNIPPGNGPLMN